MYFYKKSYSNKQTPQQQQQSKGLNILTRKRTPTPERKGDNSQAASNRNYGQNNFNSAANINLRNQAAYATMQPAQKQPPRHPTGQKHQSKQSQDINPIKQNNLADYLHSPGNVHPDTGRGDMNYNSYFNSSNAYAKSEEKQFKGTGRISKISASRSNMGVSNLSKLTNNQNQQKRMLQGQYGIRNLSHSRSRSKMKNAGHTSRPRGDISPDSPDFRTPEENIGSYFVPKSNPTGNRPMNQKIVSISGASDIQEFKRKFINQQKHNQVLQQNITPNGAEVPHIRIVMRKEKGKSNQISNISRPFNEMGLFSQQQSLSNLNDNYSAGMPLDTEGPQNDKGIGGTIYNTFSKLAQNINTIARQSMRSESFEDKEPLAHFGSGNSLKEPQNEVHDSYFDDINKDIDIPKPMEVQKVQNALVNVSQELRNKKLEVIRDSDQLHKEEEERDEIQPRNSNLDKSLNISDREKMQTLQKLSDQLNDLNNNLMNKLTDKIQMNFEKELQTIRSLSHISRSKSRVSSNSRGRRTPQRSAHKQEFGGTQSDGSGSYKRTTLISGLTFDDLSNMDISEGDIMKQSKAADMKIQLLQKQIIMMEQRAKLEGLTDRIATEENPININDFGKQSHREKRDVKLYNDLLGDENKGEIENLMGSHKQKNSSDKRVDNQINDRFTPSQKAEPNNYDKGSEIQSLLDNLPMFHKDGSLQQDKVPESPHREMEVKEDQSNVQQYIDKIPDRQLNANASVSGDSMIKLTKEYERQNNEKELNELVSIKSTKRTEKHGIKEEVTESMQTFKNKENNDVNQSSGSTQKHGQKDVINYAGGQKQMYTIETNEDAYQQNEYSQKKQTEQEYKSPDRQSNTSPRSNTSHNSSVRTDRTIDNQYVDQTNLLIQLLGKDPDTSFYGNQCQIFVGCHNTYLKQREVWLKLKRKSANIQVHPPKPDIPCDKVIEGLTMMKEGIKSHFEGVQGKKMFASQLEMQFYMVITLLEGFKKLLDEEEEDFQNNKKPVGISNNTQQFDDKLIDRMSQKSSAMYSVKSQAVKKAKGLNSETSFRQSQAFENKIKNTPYDQSIYTNNASEQGLRAGSRNKIRQSQGGGLNETIGIQSENSQQMSHPISNKVMFVGAGALDSPKMDDVSDNSNNEPPANRDTVEQISEQIEIQQDPKEQYIKQVAHSASKPQPLKVEAHRSFPILKTNQMSQEQPNRRNMIKREDTVDEGNVDLSPSPIGRQNVQISHNKNQLINSSFKQSQNSNSVFTSIKSPELNHKQNQHRSNQIRIERKLPGVMQTSNHTSISNKNMNSMIQEQQPPRQSYQQSLLDNSMRSTSKLSAQDRLYNARGKLNNRLEKEAEKMSSQAPSVTRSIGGVKIPDNARELSQNARNMRSKSPNMFQKKTAINDDGSKSKSRQRVNIFAKDMSIGNQTRSQLSGRLGSQLSGNNYSDFGNASNVITFKDFTRLSNNILKKYFMKEQYAQLVSIPSLYKKMCQQLLSGMQDDMDKEQLEQKVNEFIKIEYRKQINAYKAQFNEPQNEMKQTPQPSNPRMEETSADRVPLTPKQNFGIKPNQSRQVENVSYSFAGATNSANTGDFQGDNNDSGHLKKERSIQIQDTSGESKLDSNEGQMTLGKSAGIASPQKERKNLFGGNKRDDVSNGVSSQRKRSRIVDKSATREIIVPVKTEIIKKDDKKDIALVLEEFDKQDTQKLSQGNNSNTNQSAGTPRFKNKKVALPQTSISSSINRIPPSNSSPSLKNVDPYKRASKGHNRVSSGNNSNRQSTQSNNSQQKQPPRKSSKKITYEDIKNPFGSAGQNK